MIGKATKLGVFATHPIQYQAPWFRALAKSPQVDLKVYYAFLPNKAQQGQGFGVEFQWDVPLLEGYDYEVIGKKSAKALATADFNRFGGLAYQGLSKILKRDQIDVALITGWHSYCLVQALFICKRLGIKALVRGDSNNLRKRGWKTRLLHKLLLNRYDGFLYVGQANKAFYKSNGIPDKKLFFCPHFVDNERFAAGAEAARKNIDALQKKWTLQESDLTILFAGKLEPKKRVMDFLQAFKLAHDNDNVNLQALIVGDGEQRQQAHSFAKQNALPVSFTGFVNQQEISQCYACADVLVLPSDHGETWGLVVNEAMASGVPAIISNRVGCGPDLIIEGETGFAFEFSNVQQLADLMFRYAQDKELLDKNATAAKQNVFKKYLIGTAVEGLHEAICALR